MSALLEAKGSPVRSASTSQSVFVPNPLYAHLIPGPFAKSAEGPATQPRPVEAQIQQSVSQSSTAAQFTPTFNSVESKISAQPSRPELTEGDKIEHTVPERYRDHIHTLSAEDRASSPHSLRSTGASRSSSRARQLHRVSHAPHLPGHHQSNKESSYPVRPTEGNERFALLMSKRSRSPELPSGRYISPMMPLLHVPLAAEMLEYQTRLQDLSRANAASRAAASRSTHRVAQDVNIYSTLARSYNGEALSGYSSRSLGGDRLGSSLSRSYAPSTASNPFAASIGSYGGGLSNVSRSMESSMYRNTVHKERNVGVGATPLWAQYKYA